METISSLAIIALAGLIHASFQLSVSMLTLLSGHAIGTNASHHKVLRRASNFILGTVLMTMLVVTFVGFILQSLFGNNAPPVLWAAGCGLLIGLGIAVWAFYYRKSPGTSLWLPRSMASFLASRTKATKSSAEAFSLGMSSVFAEILFIISPVFIAGLALIHLEPTWQVVGILLYTILASLSLIIVGVMVGGGHKLSRIQKWRESNKRFLQFAAGSGLIILGFYIYVDQVLSLAVITNGGL